MKKVYLLSCSASQSRIDPNEAREARFLYFGQLFQKTYCLAKQLMKPDDDILILSSCFMHPILSPYDKITPYDSGDPGQWGKRRGERWAEIAATEMCIRYNCEETMFIIICHGALTRLLLDKLKPIHQKLCIDTNSYGGKLHKLNQMINTAGGLCHSSSHCTYINNCQTK